MEAHFKENSLSNQTFNFPLKLRKEAHFENSLSNQTRPFKTPEESLTKNLRTELPPQMIFSRNISFHTWARRNFVKLFNDRMGKLNCEMFTGKPTYVQEVLKHCKRLDTGEWIRPRIDRDKPFQYKTDKEIEEAQDHVFCSKEESEYLENLVTDYFKEKRHYADKRFRIYEPYQKGRKRPFFP